MAWTDLNFSVGQVLTAAQMNNIQANFAAVAQGKAGAPKVNSAALDNNSVGQSELKDATGAQSTTIGGQGQGSISLSGGTFAMWTISSTVNDVGAGIHPGLSNTAAGVIGLYNSQQSGSLTVYIDQRYFTASAPYETQDGRMHLFVYVMIKKGSNPIEILGVSVSPTPIWAYHGPTCIVPDFKEEFEGVVKNYRLVKAICAENGGPQGLCNKLIKLMQKGDTKSLAEISRRANDPEEKTERIEITTDYKNLDMEVAPHPWFTNNKQFLKGSEIVLLDPQATETLLLLHNQGMDLLPLIENGTIKIDSERLERVLPTSVMPVKFKF